MKDCLGYSQELFNVIEKDLYYFSDFFSILSYFYIKFVLEFSYRTANSLALCGWIQRRYLRIRAAGCPHWDRNPRGRKAASIQILDPIRFHEFRRPGHNETITI